MPVGLNSWAYNNLLLSRLLRPERQPARKKTATSGGRLGQSAQKQLYGRANEGKALKYLSECIKGVFVVLSAVIADV